MKSHLFALLLVSHVAAAAVPSIELHERLMPSPMLAERMHPATVAVTLDACGGGFDAALIEFLVQQNVPATIFLTGKWIAHNPTALATLMAHPDLFELEDHGANHVPAILDAHRHVYGMAGQPDLEHLRSEIRDGAQAVWAATGKMPHWYRGAAAVYDPAAMEAITALGFQIAGFSVNADGGASLPPAMVAQRLVLAQDGDVIIAHMNKPASGTSAGFKKALPLLKARGVHFVKLDDARLQVIR